MSKLDTVAAEVIEQGALGPTQVAEQILVRRGEWDVDEEMLRLLRLYATQLLGRRRNAATAGMVALAPVRQAAGPTSAITTYRGVVAHSAKVAKYRERSLEWLEEQVPVADSTYKRQGDCTVKDVEYLIQTRLSQAKNNRNAAARYQTLLERMRERGAEKIRDLPNEDLTFEPDPE